MPAFDRFYDACAMRLYQYLFALSHGDDALARDALQEAMIRVMHHAHAVLDEKAIWGWLKCLARTALIDLIRKEGRQQAREKRLAQLAAWEAHDDVAMAVDLRQVLAQVLQALPEGERHLLTRLYYDQCSQKDLAQELGVTCKAVESRAARARQRARRMLQARLNHEA